MLVSLNDEPYTDAVNARNEPGLYSLIMTSRKPEAREFKRWVTHKVILATRRDGFYSTQPKTELTLIIAEQLVQQNRTLTAQTGQG